MGNLQQTDQLRGESSDDVINLKDKGHTPFPRKDH
jgi:hypothetical protein